ncbi:MAG TPA: DUF2254 domain-containing protein [Casimicrobiaceae bacterium]|nr:DUF2254 domain-containing protein [Casimicrobiaceae bacterium]
MPHNRAVDVALQHGVQRPGRARRRFRRAERRLKRNLVWNRVYRATSYARSALWIVPFVAIVLVLAIAPLLRMLDARMGWRLAGLDIAGAQALYQTVITLTLSFMVFTFGSLLVAIQIAGGQLTPRIIATTLLRDNVVRYSVGLFVFSLVFAVMALNRLEKNVPELVALITAILGIVCMAAFLFLIDYAARLLRPVSVVARVGNEGLAVIENVYPHPVGDTVDGEVPVPDVHPRRIVSHVGDSAIVLAVDLETLLFEAERLDGIIELVPQVGDFLAYEEPLFALYGGAARCDDDELRATVAFGSERTIEQDPLFAFRILVDIGLKALSPAINDPTTAVLAIDQIHRLLKAVGKRDLQREDIRDDAGTLRVLFRTPNWDDYVNVSCQEIRTCGAANVQIARRLRAMLDNVSNSLPLHRRAALERERNLLDRSIERHFAYPEDLALARVPDTQGLGGSSAVRIAGRI